jgi:hypothetical protein
MQLALPIVAFLGSLVMAFTVRAKEVQHVREFNAAFQRKKKDKHTKIDDFKRKYEPELVTRRTTAPTGDRLHEEQPHAEEMN